MVDSMWTAERFSLLKQLNDTASNSCIAAQINAQTGSNFTRNAIIGKRKREGLEAPKQFSKRSRHPCVRKPSKPRKKRQPVENDLLAMFKVAPPAQLEFLEYDFAQTADDLRACRFPSGTGVPYMFCGQLTVNESSYCPYHHFICHDHAATSRSRASKSEDYLARL